MPEELKKGRVKLLFKGGEKRDPRQYRPITANSVFAKLITKIIAVRITAIVEREGFLSDSQFGFRKGRSTEDAVMIMNTMISQAKQQGEQLHIQVL